MARPAAGSAFPSRWPSRSGSGCPALAGHRWTTPQPGGQPLRGYLPDFLRRLCAGTLGKNRARDPLRRKAFKAARKSRKIFPTFPPPFYGSGKSPSQAAASTLALFFPSGQKTAKNGGKSIRGGDATPQMGGGGQHSWHRSALSNLPPAGWTEPPPASSPRLLLGALTALRGRATGTSPELALATLPQGGKKPPPRRGLAVGSGALAAATPPR